MSKKTETVKSDDTSAAMNQLADALAQKLQDRARDEAAELGQIFSAAADENRELSFEELQRVVQIRPNWSETDVKRELRRVREVRRLQAIAGTAQDRAALESALKAAREARQTQGVKLEAEIEKMQAKLQELVAAEARLVKRSDDVQTALEGLTRSLPEITESQIKTATRAMSPIVREAFDLKEELRHRGLLLEGPSERMSQSDWCDHLRRKGIPILASDDGRKVAPDPHAWAALRAQWEAERPGMEERLAGLEESIEERNAEIESMRRALWR